MVVNSYSKVKAFHLLDCNVKVREPFLSYFWGQDFQKRRHCTILLKLVLVLRSRCFLYAASVYFYCEIYCFLALDGVVFLSCYLHCVSDASWKKQWFYFASMSDFVLICTTV